MEMIVHDRKAKIMLASTKDQSMAICYVERVKAGYYDCSREAKLDNSFKDKLARLTIVPFANRKHCAGDVHQTG